MSRVNSPKLALVLAVCLPLLLAGAVSAMIYVPRLFISPPGTNFIYALGTPYSYAIEYRLEGRHIQRQRRECQYPCKALEQDPPLYLYDVSSRRSREISFDEARALELDPSAESMDGYTIERGGRDGAYSPFFAFHSYGDHGNHYLKSGGKRIRLNLATAPGSDYYYYESHFRFVGWINKAERRS